jgi:hypothetical protein
MNSALQACNRHLSVNSLKRYQADRQWGGRSRLAFGRNHAQIVIRFNIAPGTIPFVAVVCACFQPRMI